MRFFRRFLFFIYSGEICVFVRPFRFLLMNASFKNGRTFRFADYKIAKKQKQKLLPLKIS